MRVLVAIEPRMYRETLAFSLLRHRPRAEVRITSPDALGREIEGFRPDLLVCNDGQAEGAAEGARSRVEILYKDGLSANVRVDGEEEYGVRDITTADLLGILDRAEGVSHRETGKR